MLKNGEIFSTNQIAWFLKVQYVDNQLKSDLDFDVRVGNHISNKLIQGF